MRGDVRKERGRKRMAAQGHIQWSLKPVANFIATAATASRIPASHASQYPTYPSIPCIPVSHTSQHPMHPRSQHLSIPHPTFTIYCIKHKGSCTKKNYCSNSSYSLLLQSNSNHCKNSIATISIRKIRTGFTVCE